MGQWGEWIELAALIGISLALISFVIFRPTGAPSPRDNHALPAHGEGSLESVGNGG